MNRLVLVDTNNLLYISTSSKTNTEKYNNYEDITIDDVDKIYQDVLSTVIFKYFNIIEHNEGHTEVLYAKDAHKVWRRSRIFNEYKAQRVKNRNSGKVDFKILYKVFDKVWDTISDLLPARFIHTENAEADDVITRTIKKEYDEYDKFQVISTDGDFVQLLKNDKVELYNPSKFEFVTVDNPNYELFVKIMKGDRSDWIPSIYSHSRDERQKPVKTKDLIEWFNNPGDFSKYMKEQSKDVKKYFIRNKKLVDLELIPDDINDEIDVELEGKPVEFNLSNFLKIAKSENIEFLAERLELIG